MSTQPVNPTQPTTPANPPAPSIPVITIPARTYVCRVCGAKTNKAAALVTGWIEVKELDSTGMMTDDYYLCADDQTKADYLNAVQ